MFKRLFGSDKQARPTRPKDGDKTASELERLQVTIEFLEQRQGALKKKIEEQTAVALKCLRANNRTGAAQAAVRKKQLEKQLDGLVNQQANMERLMQTIMDQTTNEKVLQAQMLANKRIRDASKKVNVDAVENVVNDTTELMDQVAEVRDALQQPLPGDVVDEDDALQELEAELAGSEVAAPQQQQSVPLPTLPPVPTSQLPAPKQKSKQEEEEEQLRELEKELAM